MLHACLVPGVHKTFFFRIMILYFTTFILLFHHGKYNTITFSHAAQPPCYVVSDHLSPVSGARLPLLGTGGWTHGKASARIRLSEMENIFHTGCHKTVTFGLCLIANLYLTSNLSIRNERYYLYYNLWLSSGDLMSSP